MKTSELIGPALDWAVAKIEGYDLTTNWPYRQIPEYSTRWSQGGPIIEREGVELLCNLTATEAARFTAPNVKASWQAFYRSDRRTEARQFAETPLIAAMRAFVASKLGDEVEIPEELA